MPSNNGAPDAWRLDKSTISTGAAASLILLLAGAIWSYADNVGRITVLEEKLAQNAAQLAENAQQIEDLSGIVRQVLTDGGRKLEALQRVEQGVQQAAIVAQENRERLIRIEAQRE